RGPGIFRKLAAVSERLGDHATMMKYLEQVKKSGAAIGPRNFPAEQREIYFWALRRLSAGGGAVGEVQKAEADAAPARGGAAGATRRPRRRRTPTPARATRRRSTSCGCTSTAAGGTSWRRTARWPTSTARAGRSRMR